MSTPDDQPDALDSPVLARHEAADGTVFWGDIRADRFEKAADDFPVLKFVLETYFPSPENPSERSAQFIAEYHALGEDSSVFAGLSDDLMRAVRQYTLSATLVNGMFGSDEPAAAIRAQLADLDDQLHKRGAYAPVEEKVAPVDRFRVSNAQERMQSSWMHRIVIPVGPLNRPIPLAAYLGGGLAILLLGILVSFIPVIGRVGLLLIFLGAIVMAIMAFGIISLSKDYDEPEEDEEEDEDEGRPGLLSRFNPFSR